MCETRTKCSRSKNRVIVYSSNYTVYTYVKYWGDGNSNLYIIASKDDDVITIYPA